MAAHTCPTCGISFPPLASGLCPVHRTPMQYDAMANPDEDAIERAQRQKDLEEQLAMDGTLIPDLEPDALYEDGGKTFIFSWDVIQRGVHHRLTDGSLLRVSTTTYEVIGYIDARRSYLVKEFPMFLSEDDLDRLRSGE